MSSLIGRWGMGDITTPNCPRCGKFMDKVEVLVVNNLVKGTVPISKDLSETIIAFACPDPVCREVKNA
jgi:hypothetical protein